MKLVCVVGAVLSLAVMCVATFALRELGRVDVLARWAFWIVLIVDMLAVLATIVVFLRVL